MKETKFKGMNGNIVQELETRALKKKEGNVERENWAGKHTATPSPNGGG